MSYCMCDVDIANLICFHNPGAKYYVYSQDPYTILKEDEIEHIRDEVYELDLNPLFLEYMALYAAKSSNTNIKAAVKNNDVDSFFNTIKDSKNEMSDFRELLNTNFVPIYKSNKIFSDFSMTETFIRNYIKGKTDFDNFLAHIRAIDKYVNKDDYSFDFAYSFEETEFNAVANKLYNEGYLKEFVCLVELFINKDIVPYDSYKNKLAIAKYKLREPELLKEENQNSYTYYLNIFSRGDLVYGRLKAKLNKYIASYDVYCGPKSMEPFCVTIVIPDAQNFSKWLKFLKDQNDLFNELLSFADGDFDTILVKEITYYPQHELDFEDVDPELAKLGVGYSLRYNLGKKQE